MREAISENMKAAQTWITKYYNEKVANKEPQFMVGDWVMINGKNIKTKRLSKKPYNKLRGKFQIESLCGTNTYKLKLLPLYGKIYPILHVSLLEPYRQTTILGRHSPTLPPVDLEQQEYVIEKIKTTVRNWFSGICFLYTCSISDSFGGFYWEISRQVFGLF